MPPSLPTTLLNTISSHAGPINALTFSSQGGTYILSGSSDRSIHLSRTIPASSTQNPQPSTHPIQSYTSHGYPILSIACSPSNTTFASSSSGDREPIFLWDVSTAQTIRRFSPVASSAHTSRVNSVVFGGDSGDAVLVSGSNDTSVKIWDGRSRAAAPVVTLSEAKDAVSVVAVASDCEVLAGSVDGRVRSYDVRTGKCTVDRFPAPVTGLCMSRDGKTMVVATLDDKVRLMDRAEGTILQSFPSESPGKDPGRGEYKNSSLRLKSTFGLREEVILSGSEADGRVRAWDVLTGAECGSVEPPATARETTKKIKKIWSETHGEKEKPPVVSVVDWRGEGGLGSVGACGGVDGRVWVYGKGEEQ